MTLVDTSVWVNHFRRQDEDLIWLLENNEASTHDFVIGELACGNLHDRKRTLSDLQTLPRVSPVATEDVLFLIDQKKLQGRGLGWADMHLLAAVAIAGHRIYSHDQTLATAARSMHCHYAPQRIE
jgi:predicted nucleic acid-binding protein